MGHDTTPINIPQHTPQLQAHTLLHNYGRKTKFTLHLNEYRSTSPETTNKTKATPEITRTQPIHSPTIPSACLVTDPALER